MSRRLAICLAVMALPWLMAPAPAQESKQPEAPDPNERVCENIKMIGSRLATKRICATRAEWEDKRRQDREAVEKGQMVACLPGGKSC